MNTIEDLIKICTEMHKVLCEKLYCLYCKNDLHNSGEPSYVGQSFFNSYEEKLYKEKIIFAVIKCGVCRKKAFLLVNKYTTKFYAVPYDYFSQEEEK